MARVELFRVNDSDKDITENTKFSKTGRRSVALCSVLDYTGQGYTRHTSLSQVSASTESWKHIRSVTETFSTRLLIPPAPLMA